MAADLAGRCGAGVRTGVVPGLFAGPQVHHVGRAAAKALVVATAAVAVHVLPPDQAAVRGGAVADLAIPCRQFIGPGLRMTRRRRRPAQRRGADGRPPAIVCGQHAGERCRLARRGRQLHRRRQRWRTSGRQQDQRRKAAGRAHRWRPAAHTSMMPQARPVAADPRRRGVCAEPTTPTKKAGSTTRPGGSPGSAYFGATLCPGMLGVYSGPSCAA